MKTLPVPIEFRLPGPEWDPVPPESVGVENAAFLAMRRENDGGGGASYHPTISISGDWRMDPATLEEIAEESVVLLRGQAREIELLSRDTHGSDQAPAVTQLMRALVDIDGREWDLRQGQVVSGLIDVDDPRRRVVVIYTLTCAEHQFEEVGREFQQFMATVKPVPPTSETVEA